MKVKEMLTPKPKFRVRICFSLSSSWLLSKQMLMEGNRFMKKNTSSKKFGFSNVKYLAYNKDYGHTKAKSLILCGPNLNPNPK